MNSYRRNRGGYTILEVIIVLTISSLLFVSTLVAYNRQNNRTQFTESVNTFAQNIQDVMNDVETGFYPSNNSFTCFANPSGGAPTIDYSAPTQQGTNTDCIFVGKAIQFAPGPSSSTNKSNIDVYSIVGRRLVGGTTESVVNIDDAGPVGLDNLIDRKSLTAGVQIASVKSADGSQIYSGFAMVSTSNAAGGISSGLNSRASLAVITGNINNTKPTFLNRIRLINSSNITAASNGLNICVREPGAGGRTAVIGLATGESQIIVNTNIDQSCT